jgi:hypothetical protein
MGQGARRIEPPNTLLKNYVLYNPADAGYGREVEAFSNYSSYIGIRKSIKILNTNFFFPANQEKSLFIGASFYNHQEGKFIRHNAFNGIICYQLFDTRKSRLHAGFSFGLTNFQFLDNLNGPTGSDSSPDGTFGIYYTLQEYTVGASIAQLFNTTFTPLSSTIHFPRNYNFFFYREIEGESFHLRPEVWYQYSPNFISFMKFGFIADLFSTLSFTTYYRTNSAITVGAGVQNQFENNLLGRVHFSYSINTSSQNRINSERYEIILLLKKNQ